MTAPRSKHAATRKRKQPGRRDLPIETPQPANRWVVWIVFLGLTVGFAWGVGSLAGVLSRPSPQEPPNPIAVAPPTVSPSRAAYRAPQDFDSLKEESFQTAMAFLQRFPNDIQGLSRAAQLAGVFGEKELAMQYWRRCVERVPSNLQAWYALGWLAMRDAEYEQSAEYARRALEIAPEADNFRDLLGLALIEVGEAGEALQVLEANVDRGRASCDTYTLLGKVHLLNRDYEQAVHCYEEAVRLDPVWTKALYGLGTANARLGRRDEAAAAFVRFRASRANVSPQSDQEELLAARNDVAIIYRSFAELYANYGDQLSADELMFRSTQFDIANRGPASQLHHMSGGISDESPE